MFAKTVFEVQIVDQTNVGEGFAVLVGEGGPGHDTNEFPTLLLRHVARNGCGLTGSCTGLYDDRVVSSESFQAQKVGHIPGSAGSLGPTVWQGLYRGVGFVAGDLVNLVALLVQDPDQIIDIQNTTVVAPLCFVSGRIVVATSFAPLCPNGVAVMMFEDRCDSEPFCVILDVLARELVKDGPDLFV